MIATSFGALPGCHNSANDRLFVIALDPAGVYVLHDEGQVLQLVDFRLTLETINMCTTSQLPKTHKTTTKFQASSSKCGNLFISGEHLELI